MWGDSPKVLECGLGHNRGRVQDGRQICHGSPTVNSVRERCGSTIAASLSVCSQQGIASATMGFANFVGAHVEAGLKSELITSAPVVEVAPECSGSNSDFCGHTHQVTGSITESHILADSSWGRTRSGSFPRGSTPVPPISHHSSELDLGPLLQQLGRRP